MCGGAVRDGSAGSRDVGAHRRHEKRLVHRPRRTRWPWSVGGRCWPQNGWCSARVNVHQAPDLRGGRARGSGDSKRPDPVERSGTCTDDSQPRARRLESPER